MMNWMAQLFSSAEYTLVLSLWVISLHFAVGAFVLLKYAFTAQNSWAIWTAAIVSFTLAIVFGIVLLRIRLRQRMPSKSRVERRMPVIS